MDRTQCVQELFQHIDGLRRLFALYARQDRGRKQVHTPTQICLMQMLSHHGPQHVKQLAERFNMTSSAVTQLVTLLVKQGILTRTEDTQDRRRLCVALTPKGVAALTGAKAKRLVQIQKILEPLSDQELTQLHTIQQKITTHLQHLCPKNHKTT